jgi:ADP-ribose pyrophosphatase YjhB (NUDIX family)
MEKDWKERFGGRVRLRICGILKEGDRLLMVKHQGLGPEGFLWNPPGGGVQFGESYADTLIREFREETGLEVEPVEFILFNEHIGDDIHAVELFFSVRKTGGNLALGHDPELPADNQMLKDIRFWNRDEITPSSEPQFHKRWKEFF